MIFVAASPDKVGLADRARPSKRIRLFMGQMSSLILRSRSKFFCNCARSFSANRSHFAGSCARTTRSRRCSNSSRSCMPLAIRFLGQAAAALVLATATFKAIPAACAEDEFPFGLEMTLDAARQPGSKRIPTLDIGDNGEATLDLWCKGGKGQFSVAGNTVIFDPGPLQDRDCPPARAQADDE